ncbi:hypothetical protein [Fodinibius halophilus]|uniref:SPOR domain-containing protein n=1 Tax=Fodinibius halophilus TaxID=1736908 RepID=A0A6M1TC75_9BACT|nr:hypothetical protein [Fodinibius halophilus]NGP87832.1 hypothetical protein [Fodinibius halophilus]
MTLWRIITKFIGGVTAILLFAIGPLAQAQNQASEATEVFLSFQYEGVVSVYVTSYYKDGEFFLPVNELFNQLKIQHEVNQGDLTISGNYLGKKSYLLDFKNLVASAGGTEIQLQQDDFFIKEIDYFIRPELFKRLFGLSFETDFNNLTLDLKTNDKMPVVAQYEREQQRQRLSDQDPLYDQSYYPLRYGRNYAAIDGSFLDYNFSGVYTNNSQLFTFSNALGAELAGGDIQGSVFGSLSEQQTSFTTSNLRWRYVQRNNNLFSSGILGQTNTEGIRGRAITGFKISNKPVEPRLLFDRYIIDGNVPPQSEVELYLNNRLIDFQEADQTGNYRFIVPLTYGSTNYSLRIYTPSGQTVERSSRIQIPFDFVPKGKVDYVLSGGRLQNNLVGTTTRGYTGAASVSAGVSNWLTAQVSSEYLTAYHTGMPAFTGTLNARLFSNYLVSASANSENFYRLTSSVVYGSGASWNISYNYNPGNSQLYNIGGGKHQLRASLFTPFQIGIIPLNMRWSTSYRDNNFNRIYRYRADLSSRIGRLNIRVGYQDQQSGAISFAPSFSSQLTNSYTYSIGRSQDIPKLLRGMFIRGQLTYLPGVDQFEEVEFQLSRELFRTGRIQFTYGHNFLGDFNSLSLNLTIDFNKVRSNSTTRFTNANYSATQNIRGSIGYDPGAGQLLLNNRQQVGQSAAAVRLFIDSNNDGTYQEDTDQVIDEPAVRLNRSGGRNFVKNGVNYVTQLLPYYRYDLEINKGAISNPLLVPEVENFSIVTDPNQYKTINIPFYQSGVISGNVEQQKDTVTTSLSGVRLYLESKKDQSNGRDPFSKEIRTFSDGSFYAYEIPPGKYNLYIDPSQLDFLNSVSRPDTMEIKIKALAQGDFKDGLNFLVTKEKSREETQEDTLMSKRSNNLPQVDGTHSLNNQELEYQIQLASFETLEKAKRVALQASQQLGGAFCVIKNSSTNLYAIRNTSLLTQNQAVETILSYHKKNYKSAAIVVLKNKKSYSNTNNRQEEFIQIGAFNSHKKAEQFAEKSSRDLNKETALTYHQKSNLYKVYLNEGYQDGQDLRVQLASIKNGGGFNDAYINERGNIQIAAFNKQTKAKAYAAAMSQVLEENVSYYHDQENKHFNVYIDKEFKNIRSKRALLKRIKSQSSIYKDAFIASMNSKNIVNISSQDRMRFTYQVYIRNTQSTGKSYLASLIDSNENIAIQSDNNNLIIFDQVSSWSQAQEMQHKLLKKDKACHPIIILIEE